jgi:stage III sporulation protein AB
VKRVLGFFLLQAAALLFFRQYRQRGKRQLDTLRSFADMLEHLRGILEADSPPMPELLQTLLRRCRGDAGAFIETLAHSMDMLGSRSFYELWRQALREKSGLLDPDILYELESLGEILGRYELKVQLEAVDLCRAMLLKALNKLQKEQPQASRLTLALLLSGTLMLGIVLI